MVMVLNLIRWMQWLDTLVGCNGWIQGLDTYNGWIYWLDTMVGYNGWIHRLDTTTRATI